MKTDFPTTLTLMCMLNRAFDNTLYRYNDPVTDTFGALLSASTNFSPVTTWMM